MKPPSGRDHWPEGKTYVAAENVDELRTTLEGWMIEHVDPPVGFGGDCLLRLHLAADHGEQPCRRRLVVLGANDLGYWIEWIEEKD